MKPEPLTEEDVKKLPCLFVVCVGRVAEAILWFFEELYKLCESYCEKAGTASENMLIYELSTDVAVLIKRAFKPILSEEMWRKLGAKDEKRA